VLDPGVDPDAIVRSANGELADQQRIRRSLVWPEPALPRTDGTRKLKRALIREWAAGDGAPRQVQAGADALSALVARYSGRTDLAPGTTLEELGLSSLERDR
jgi:long-chain acyl-CoA synthetase